MINSFLLSGMIKVTKLISEVKDSVEEMQLGYHGNIDNSIKSLSVSYHFL